MKRNKKTLDGNTAAAHVAYAFSDVASIYPITPSTVMAELSDKWSASGRKNIFGQEVKVMEMQSEAGAAGTVHGSLAAGALTSTFTASQGLLLMIPNMYKMAGEQLPAVIHVSARAIGTHALSIFGDHSDVMACRQTGFAMLAETNPQEIMDLSPVAHLAAIKGRIPFLNFFDGFRTSHEMQKVALWDYEDLKDMADMDAISKFRKNALNPEHPVLRGSTQNDDIFFQSREACNTAYNELPAIVEEYMDKVNKKLGTNYGLFNYYGAADADRVIVAMGSVCDTIEEVIDYMNANGEKVGLIKVRLFRPFVTSKFLSLIPKTAKKIAVLDRTKEPGSQGEPLYQDIVTAISSAGLNDISVVGGRYGLASSDTIPADIFATYENLKSTMKPGFTIGIVDDITKLSLNRANNSPDVTPASTVSCKFWGLGADGTVGANKNSIKIIGDHTDLNVQAYFAYDSKKSGGVTISHLRFGSEPIKATYLVNRANFVACHNPSYIDKYEMVEDLKEGGSFLLNCAWDLKALEIELPAHIKRYLATNKINFYTIDGIGLAQEIGLGGRINMILQAAFFKISNIIPIDDATAYMKKAIVDTYGKKGEKVVAMNNKAVDAGVMSVNKIDIPASWANATDATAKTKVELSGSKELVDYVENVLIPVANQCGAKLPVSTFMPYVDGTVPQGSAAYEKRGIAVTVPEWQSEHCIQCNQCSYVCPHGVIRPTVMTKEEAKNAPADMKLIPMTGKGCEDLVYAITVSTLDCTGCGSCVNVCPAKNKAIVMKPIESQMPHQAEFDYAASNKVSAKTIAAFPQTSVKGSQFKQPLLEFSGACAGCGETPYAKLVTQLFGEKMYIANATGCSSIWGGSSPSTPYTTNHDGHGPAWANSLFEDNAEYGLGMYLAVNQMRDGLKMHASHIIDTCSSGVSTAAKNWIDTMQDSDKSSEASAAFIEAIKADGTKCEHCKYILDHSEFLTKKSMWIFGGDGWAYDIGFGGLDHVIASGEDVNILVFDTEIYSNTGGQSSKSSQIGQVAQFAASGKKVAKKNLGEIAMSYGHVYVAQIGMGSSMPQTIKALTEAESYKGPSLVIAYSPCISHGIKSGMGSAQTVIKNAVEAGYWHLYRFDPRLKEDGRNPFQLDSKAPSTSYVDFINSETRYTSLKLQYPAEAEKLFAEASEEAKHKYDKLVRMSKLYE